MTEVQTAPVAAPPGRSRFRRGPLLGRSLFLVTAVLVAYHYSLESVFRQLGADSPLAYLGLVPFVAAGFGVVLARPRVGELSVHDRYLDCMIGVPAMLVPIFVMVVLPARLSTFFWYWRIDLLTLPLFVAGLVALLFGTRTLLRTKASILYLALVWPVPIQFLLSRWLDEFTSLSIRAVTMICHVVPLATPFGTVDGAFTIDGPAGKFDLVVASACSGANSLLGFLLLAVPTAVIAVGTRRRKVAWLAVGSVVVWIVNVLRILVVFTAGKLWGETVAIDGFHPYIGLVAFALATAAMVWVMPRFGLTFAAVSPRRKRLLIDEVRAAVPSWKRAACWIVACSALLAVFNAGLRSVDPVASALGAPRLLPFTAAASRLDHYTTRRVDSFDFARRYYGDDSNWLRYQVASRGGTELGSDIPVFADVVTTSDASTFDDFGIEACYRFHGYDVSGRAEVDLGSGQVGTVLSWKDPRSPITFTSLYWYWPVSMAGSTRYQRVVLLLDSSSDGRVWSPKLADNLLSKVGIAIDERLQGSSVSTKVDRRNAELRQYLIGLGRALVVSSKPTTDS